MSYLITGVKGVQDMYKRDTYRANPTIHYSGHVDNFTGTVKVIKQDATKKKITIDDVFSITIIADNVIRDSKNVWRKLQERTKKTFFATFIGGLVGIAAAVAMGVLSSGLLISAIAVGVLALSFLAIKRNLEAKKELKKWKKPVNDLIKKCKYLNIRLKAEHNMKEEIITEIHEVIHNIFEKSLTNSEKTKSESDLSKMLMDNRLANLAFTIHSKWTSHNFELIKKHRMTIPKEAIYEVLDTLIKAVPAYKDLLKVVEKTIKGF